MNAWQKINELRGYEDEKIVWKVVRFCTKYCPVHDTDSQETTKNIEKTKADKKDIHANEIGFKIRIYHF